MTDDAALVEKMAEAMHAFTLTYEGDRDYFPDMARVALAVVREVTDEMVEAGSRAYIVALGGDGTWGELSEETRDGERRFMRAALTAALQGGNDAD